MNIVKIIANNIKELMDNTNTSARSLAKVLNVTHPTISNYVSGEKTIDSEKLYLLSEYFNKNLDYFFTEEHKEISLMFRADKPSKNLDNSDVEKIIDCINKYIELEDKNEAKYIPQQYTLSTAESSLTDENEQALEKIALEQRRLFGIENIIPDNYFSIISSIGINVLCYKLNNDNFFGASSFSKEHGSFIFVNSNNKIVNEERQIFSLIHELGHLIFHQNEYQDPDNNPFYEKTRGNVKEKIVDTFSGYFLLPREMVIRYIEDRKNDHISPISMKKHFKVSIQALYISLKKYGLISEEKYRTFWKNVNIKGWKKKEPEPLEHIPLESKNAKLLSNLKKLYLNEEISADKVREILDYDHQEVRQLLKDWSNSTYEEFDSIL